MKISSVVLVTCLAACPVTRGWAGTADTPAKTKVGQIFILGNGRTRQNVILDQVEMYPGQDLNEQDLRRTRENLERLNIFEPGGVTVSAECDPNNPASGFKNIFVSVKETSTGEFKLVSGYSFMGVPSVSLVWDERNFDPTRWPVDFDDLQSGDAFRGGGVRLRLALVQLPTPVFNMIRPMQVESLFGPVCP